MNHTLEQAKLLDQNDPLCEWRKQFFIPTDQHGIEKVYLCGNSLGLQPKSTADAINQELHDWATLGVDGHTHGKYPWLPYHEFLMDKMATLVGARKGEVVVMNSLTVNIHLLFASFYRPSGQRKKILIEANAFPSDVYAVKSQLRFHGCDPEEDLIIVQSSSDDDIISNDDFKNVIANHTESIALIFIGGVNYYTGQVFDIKYLSSLAKEVGCPIGIDLAHGVGNIKLNLHDDHVDFAAWCTYKYLNSGPGSLSGVFIHSKHSEWGNKPRFEGWWGQNKGNRFLMNPEFEPISGVEGWQLSNPPILSMAAIRASLEIFHQVGMDALVAKSDQLISYLRSLLSNQQNNLIKIITPEDRKMSGCQISIKVTTQDQSIFQSLIEQGVIADWRAPDVIRIAPVPLYNSFEDVFRFSEALHSVLKNRKRHE